MTTPTITRDVNEAFAAERRAMVGRIEWLRSTEGAAQYIAEQTRNFEGRVAAGELVKVGEGRYQSTQGWDRGEVWTVTAVNGESLVLPEHGLDINPVTGKARLFTSVPAWHGLGQEAYGITDVEDVITLGQLDVPAYSIPAAPYEVPGIGLVTPSGAFHVGNGNTGEYWGTVGKVHKNIPVRTSFAFMQNIVDNGSVMWESAGMMGGGRQVFIACELPEGVTIDAGGVADNIRMFLVVQDTRDGNGSYKAMLTPWRPQCQNTNRFALRDAPAVVRLRHTTNLPGRIEQARQVLGITVKYAAEFGAEETLLARTACTWNEAEKLLAEISADEAGDSLSGRMFGARDKDAETNRTAGSNDRREADVRARWNTETERAGATLYAAEQAYTGHLDWGKVRKGDSAAARWTARIEASLAGDDDGAKSRAHARLLELVTR